MPNQFSQINWAIRFGKSNLFWQILFTSATHVGDSLWQFCLVTQFGNLVWKFSLDIQFGILFSD
jgi:hypothetical protein